MPQPSATPGVYIQEVPSQNKPIDGVGTSVAAFVGLAPWGPVNTPTRVTSWIGFARVFGVPPSKDHPQGPFMEGAYLAHAVYGFFQNGGGACWVVRVGSGAYGSVPQKALPSAAEQQRATFRVLATEAVQALKQPVSVTVNVKKEAPPAADAKASASKESSDKESSGKESEAKSPSPEWQPNPTFTVEVKVGDESKTYEHLTVTHGPRYLPDFINANSEFVEVLPGDGGAPVVPAEGEYTLAEPEPATEAPKLTDLVGDSSYGTGLEGLSLTEEITMVCVPDLMSLASSDNDIREVQTALADACTRGRRMAILDPPQGLTAQQIGEWQQNDKTPPTPFATLYWPWIRVLNPADGQLIEVPPCGHVAGLWARTDQTRGVFKAPANEVVMGAVDLAIEINNDDQDPLNRHGVNCIRGFHGRGIRTWGARTLATDGEPEWKYINVRRLFNYLTASIAQGTSWAVFEPNDEMLWGQLRIAVTNFLMGVWREGGLFGASPDEAFFVKCDAETNPPDLIEAGQVNIVVGVAPVEPAEFVMFKISQHQPAT
jgi:uncharacterized protein